MQIIKLNDLYFPQGNENGNYYESYFKIIDENGNIGYGQTPEIAKQNVKK